MNPTSVLVTGHEGYIGSVLTRELMAAGYRVSGLDTGFFRECAWEPQTSVVRSLTRDIRDISAADIAELAPDMVIHLAGLSNDPLGELSPGITEEINYKAAIGLLDLAQGAGVSRFVYFSSQSMYGVSDSAAELDEDNSEKNPVTAYAATKWAAELEILARNAPNFVTSALRPSTVFGPSPCFRSDIIMNNMTSLALETGVVTLKTDGTPWRPIVHIDDVAQAAIGLLAAPAEIVGGRAFNLGVPNGNYTVRQIADSVAEACGVPVEIGGALEQDPRSYQVSFARILSELAEWYVPQWDLESGARGLSRYLQYRRAAGFDLLSERTIRLKKLQELQASGRLDRELRWTSAGSRVS